MAPECSGLPAGARGKHVHSDRKADTHAVSQRNRQNGGSSNAKEREAFTDYSAETAAECVAAVGKRARGYLMKLWVGITDDDWFRFLAEIKPERGEFLATKWQANISSSTAWRVVPL